MPGRFRPGHREPHPGHRLDCNSQDNQRWSTSLQADTSPPSVPGTPSVSTVTCSTARMAWPAASDDVGVTACDLYQAAPARATPRRGWPACKGTSGDCGRAGFLAPKLTYPTSQGSCSGLTVVRDVGYVACARGERMYRAVISGSSLTDVQQFFVGTYGRLRTVEPAAGGGLWLTTTNGGDKDSTPNNSDNRIFRVTLGD